MQCPHCDQRLKRARRQGVDIDYCPQCHGVWLDRGELEKIVERSRAPSAARPSEGRVDQSADASAERDEGRGRPGNFLSELFDFGE